MVQPDGLSRMAAGNPAIAHLLGRSIAKKLVWTLKGGDDGRLREQPRGQFQHGFGVRTETVKRKNQRRPAVHSGGDAEQVMAVEPHGEVAFRIVLHVYHM